MKCFTRIIKSRNQYSVSSLDILQQKNLRKWIYFWCSNTYNMVSIILINYWEAFAYPNLLFGVMVFGEDFCQCFPVQLGVKQNGLLEPWIKRCSLWSSLKIYAYDENMRLDSEQRHLSQYFLKLGGGNLPINALEEIEWPIDILTSSNLTNVFFALSLKIAKEWKYSNNSGLNELYIFKYLSSQMGYYMRRRMLKIYTASKLLTWKYSNSGDNELDFFNRSLRGVFSIWIFQETRKIIYQSSIITIKLKLFLYLQYIPLYSKILKW